MKLLISFVSALMLILASMTVSNAATTRVTTVTTVTKTVVSRAPCKHYKHYKHKKHYKKIYRTPYRYYYSPGYCVTNPCSSCCKAVCYPATHYQCRTTYYYHSGRNTARVEECY